MPLAAAVAKLIVHIRVVEGRKLVQIGIAFNYGIPQHQVGDGQVPALCAQRCQRGAESQANQHDARAAGSALYLAGRCLDVIQPVLHRALNRFSGRVTGSRVVETHRGVSCFLQLPGEYPVRPVHTHGFLAEWIA